MSQSPRGLTDTVTGLFVQILSFLVMCLIRGRLGDILINEVNCDNPFSDTAEFVELWNPDNCSRSLDGYTLVFFNGFVSPAVVYRNVSLSGYCIEKRGYFVVGSSSVTPTPDITAFVSNGIQNGVGNADAIALYKNYHVPENLTQSDLVDAIIYDKKPVTNADKYFPSLMSAQTPVFENEALLESDESMSRCGDEALHLDAFVTGELSPGADNFCFISSSGTWLTDCAAYTEYTSDFSQSFGYYSLTFGSKVAGSPFLSQGARSRTECAKKCLKYLPCFRFSFTESADFEYNCLLYFSCQSILDTDELWMVGTRSV